MRRAGVLLACLALAACSVTPWVDDESATRPPQVELAGVPFHPQAEYQCGPAALATVFGAAGVDTTPAGLVDAVYLPKRRGTLQVEMLAATRRQGLLPYVLPPRLGAILDEVAAGHPVLVLQKTGIAPLADWHYAVVVGYDLAAGEVVLRSGGERRQIMSLGAFSASWQRAGQWAFVALPEGGLPAVADEPRVVAAIVALEKVDPAAAGRFYESALVRWPGSLAARLGVGNAAWRRHDLAVAVSAFRRATQDHPGSADAWNNLALALQASGRRDEAVVAARRAVGTGGPHPEDYAATLGEVMSGRRQDPGISDDFSR